MDARVKLLISIVLTIAMVSVVGSLRVPSRDWMLFAGYLAAVLLSSGMKVYLPRGGDGTMSVNFPFIFLAIIQLSPLQAISLAALSVFAQCKFRVQKFFSLVQIAFNVANAVNATAASWLAYEYLLRHRAEVAPALSLAAVVFFFASSIPVALVIAWTKEARVLPVWTSNFAWFLPFYLVGAALSALAYFLSLRHGWLTSLLVLPVAYTIYRSYNAQMARIREQARHIDEVEALHLRTIEGLAMAIEAKDQDTHDHLLRVRVYVTEIGKDLELTDAEMQAVKTAALLHDIGKLAVPERIINKPGKLTREEFEKMKIHPSVGADILERVRFPYPVVPIVRSHHEWWNGQGYPDGLRGEAIPIGARILTVVDSFDAMASDRPYRRAMAPAEAMAMVKKLAGTQFDPRVVEVLEERYAELEEHARREGEKLIRLDTDIQIARGTAPGAGFEQDSAEAMAEPAAAHLKSVADESHAPVAPVPPLSLIAAASDQAQALLEMTEAAGFGLGVDETLHVLASRLRPLIPFDCYVFYRLQQETLVPSSLQGQSALCFSQTSIALGEGLSGWAALHERAIVNGNAAVEPNYKAPSDELQALHSALAIPLRALDQSIYGVLSFYAAPADAFARHHLRALEAIELKITLALSNAQRSGQPGDRSGESQPVHLLLSTLEAALEQSRVEGVPLSVLVCALSSGFPPREASLSPGSHLEAQGAHAAQRCLQRGESLFLVGDQFVFLLAGQSAVQARSRAEHLQDQFEEAMREQQLRAGLSGSGRERDHRVFVGVASYSGEAASPEALLAQAERQMLATLYAASPRPQPRASVPPVKPAVLEVVSAVLQATPSAFAASLPGLQITPATGPHPPVAAPVA